jgi:hypothetical protein
MLALCASILAAGIRISDKQRKRKRINICLLLVIINNKARAIFNIHQLMAKNMHNLVQVIYLFYFLLMNLDLPVI